MADEHASSRGHTPEVGLKKYLDGAPIVPSVVNEVLEGDTHHQSFPVAAEVAGGQHPSELVSVESTTIPPRVRKIRARESPSTRFAGRRMSVQSQSISAPRLPAATAAAAAAAVSMLRAAFSSRGKRVAGG